MKCCTPDGFWRKLTRTKTLEDDLMQTTLKRCLSTPLLVLFGIGQMSGAGIYVLTGEVMKTQAGAATFVAYIIGGLISLLSALCYAEFGSRVPKAGSSFTFAYVTVGEFMAFVIGWNIILEHAITTAATARAWSGSVDILANRAISNFTNHYIGEYNIAGNSNHLDFIAPTLVILLAVLVIVGAKETMSLSAFIALTNIIICTIIVGTCFSVADVANLKNEGNGGFMPHGFAGLFGGTAMLIYAYSGYDAITIAAEETKNPMKALPVANVSAMVIVTVIYTVMSLALALVVPFDQVDPNAAFSAAFQRLGIAWAEVIVAIGALVAITGVCLGNVYSVSRTGFAMARDGLLFEFISYVNPKTQTPIVSIIIFAIIAAILAFFLDVAALAEFVSIGTLIAVTLVSTCVVVLRYNKPQKTSIELTETNKSTGEEDTSGLISPSSDVGKLKPRFQQVPIIRDMRYGSAVSVSLASMFLPMAMVGILIKYTMDGPFQWWPILIAALCIAVVVFLYLIIEMHQIDNNIQTFKMPLVPFLPVLSMFLNTILLMQLSPWSWLRFVIWMMAGFMIYFGYGIWHSKEREQVAPLSEAGKHKSYEATKVIQPNTDTGGGKDDDSKTESET